MQNYINRIAAVLAWIIGAMGVFAGGQALMGRLPGWNVISWLPVYNFVIGGLVVLVCGTFRPCDGQYWPRGGCDDR